MYGMLRKTARGSAFGYGQEARSDQTDLLGGGQRTLNGIACIVSNLPLDTEQQFGLGARE